MGKSAKAPAKKSGSKLPRKLMQIRNSPGGGHSSPHEKPVRKNHYLYQSKIDLAKEILGAKTETEALDMALDILIYGEALAEGTESMAGEDYYDVLGIALEIPGAGKGA